MTPLSTSIISSQPNMSKPNGGRSVRFAASVGAPKRHREEEKEDSFDKKRSRIADDDEDDVDMDDDGDDLKDWKNRKGESNGDEYVPSEHQLLAAKNKRREQRGASGDTSTKGLESTNIDATTSLATEGVEIEPFHMRQEQSDGSGFFDGDTYVFRKSNPEDETDAWLESLDESGSKGNAASNAAAARAEAARSEAEESAPSMDDWSREDLYHKIVPLVSDTETIMKAIQRFGLIAKKKRIGAKSKNKNSQQDDENDAELKDRQDLAKASLDDLTGAASALLLKGDVNIYDMTRNDILKLFSRETESETKQEIVASKSEDEGKPTKWEYKGNQDGQVHGPYTTAEMLAWTGSGYFIGEHQVQIRTVREEVEESSSNDDLLADLMDDDDDEKPKEPTIVKGEWQWSNNVNFKAYK